MKSKLLSLMLLASLGTMPASIAKPMPAATLEEASEQSSAAVVARFVDYEKPPALFSSRAQKRLYSKGLIARYQLLSRLDYNETPIKGDPFLVRYVFHDERTRSAPPGWKFKEELLPEKGSEWILFLKAPRNNTDQTVYKTYRGSFGRLPSTDDNQENVGAYFEDRD